ncbi:MAG TPA: GNAT family N-acetyltransferase [Actinomycetota bacterium]|nr:GNAT family N-acetyltransferase [Actinomycetota bacterium]
MEILIRTIRDDERSQWLHAGDAAFSEILKDDEVEASLPTIETDRSFVALDGDRMVGTAAAITTRMAVPGGGRVPTAAVTMVGVNPTHRRRGINTQMMAALLEQAAERGEPLAALFASEGAIYGRFGYGLAAFIGEFQAESARMDFVRGIQVPGRVELLPREEALPIIGRVYDAALRTGGVERSDVHRDHVFTHIFHDERDKPWFYAVHRTENDEADAYAVYTMKHEWPRSIPSGILEVKETMASTPSGYAAIWRYLFDVDLVATVEAWNRPADEPLLQLVREPRRLRFGLMDGLWVRLVDIPAALAARRYRVDGRVVFDVSDRFQPSNDGRYELVVERGVGRCERVETHPDLAGTVNVLGATYLGGVSFTQLGEASQVRELSEGALAVADAMFASSPAPWCPWAF